MRQGNHFCQHIDQDKWGLYIRVPMEVSYELEEFQAIMWVSNGDGTYTLIPKNNS